MMLFFIIYGIATFGAVLYIQQVSRAAEDGARAVPMLLSPPLAPTTQVRDTVYDSLAAAPSARSDRAPLRRAAESGSRRMPP